MKDNEWGKVEKSDTVKLTEDDWDTKFDFESIILYGKSKVGKTYSAVTLIDEELKKNKDIKFHIICTDNGFARTYKSYFKDRAEEVKKSINYFPVTDVTKMPVIIEDIKSKAKLEDWIIVDLISDFWDFSQDKFIESNIRAFGGDASQYIVNASKDVKKFGMFAGQQWQYIKRLDNPISKELATRPFCNLFATAGEKDVGIEVAFIESAQRKGKDVDKSELLSLYEKVGFKPNGQKNLSYSFSTIVYITGIQNKTYQVVGDRGRMALGDMVPYGDNFWKKFSERERSGKNG